MKKVYMFLATGFEVLEAVAPLDVLRRAGIEVVTVSLTDDLYVEASNGVVVKADASLSTTDVLGGDGLILPGGYPGYVNLAASDAVGRAAKFYFETQRLVAAICGAPLVLQRHGIGLGRCVTSHSSIKDEMTGFTYTGASVEADGNLVTSIGAGHAIDFGLAILRHLAGQEGLNKVMPGMEL